MAEINDLTTVDASNTARFPENQAPSTVNNGARALEGIAARFHRDLNTSVTTTGTSTVYVYAANQTLSAYYDGMILGVDFHTACGATPTINVDAIGAKSLKWPNGTALAAGDVATGQKALLVYDGTDMIVLTAGGNVAALNTGADAGEIAVNEQNWTAIASAATVNIGAAATERVNITGTTTITAFDTVTAGLSREVRFDGALTLTHNGTSLILPSGANITTAAGDIAKFVSEGSGNWRCVKYMTASGVGIVAPTAAQGASMVLLGSYSPSAAASVDATSLITSTYRKYFVTFDLVPATDDVQLQMLTSTNNGVAFDSGASNYDYACRRISSGAASADYISTGATFIPLSRASGGTLGIGNATNEGVSGNIWIHDPLNAATYTRVSMVSDGADTNSLANHFEGVGQRLSAGDVDAFQLKFSSGNLTGEVRVYGIKDA